MKRNTKEWLEKRKHGIGGTDVAPIMGLSKYRTALDVYLDKTSKKIEDIDNPKMEWGRRLEDVIAKKYKEMNKATRVSPGEMVIHNRMPYLFANPDRFLNIDTTYRRGILEIKTVGEMQFKKWDGEIPVEYQCQIQHYFDCCNAIWGEFAILVGGWDFKTIKVERDNEFISMKNEVLEEFWKKHVLKNKPPDPKTESDIKYLFPRSNTGKFIEMAQETYDIYFELKKVKEEMDELETRKKLFEEQLKLAMLDAEELKWMDQTVITWKTGKDKQEFDLKRFLIDHTDDDGELDEELKPYFSTKTGNRTFLLK